MPERADQAAGLRRLFSRERLRVVSFAAGSPGVGKSLLVANLAACLARQGRGVLVLDENAGRRDVASCFGKAARYDLADVVDGKKSMAEVLLDAAPGVRVLPMAVAAGRFGRMDEAQRRALETELAALDAPPEVLLADTSLDHPLGFSPLSLAAHHTVIVMAPTPVSITEAYALIKKASLCHARRDYRVLVNGTRGPEGGRPVFGNVARVTHGRRFARLEYAGCVPLDERLPRAAALGQPAVGLYPDSPAARACRALAGELMDWPLPEGERGGLEQFVRHLLHFCRHMDPVAVYA
ncbi:MAG: MinD/ParA family protein [Candidatus Accumulibacter sp.]|jgi:flagellar biosynthesis protein FlhG|nr:MinD/ParA family protein [Accumulibacter sp.]